MVRAILALDVVGEEGISQTVRDERFVPDPSVVRSKELVAVVEPRGGDDFAHGEIDARKVQIVSCD